MQSTPRRARSNCKPTSIDGGHRSGAATADAQARARTPLLSRQTAVLQYPPQPSHGSTSGTHQATHRILRVERFAVISNSSLMLTVVVVGCRRREGSTPKARRRAGEQNATTRSARNAARRHQHALSEPGAAINDLNPKLNIFFYPYAPAISPFSPHFPAADIRGGH